MIGGRSWGLRFRYVCLLRCWGLNWLGGWVGLLVGGILKMRIWVLVQFFEGVDINMVSLDGVECMRYSTCRSSCFSMG